MWRTRRTWRGSCGWCSKVGRRRSCWGPTTSSGAPRRARTSPSLTPPCASWSRRRACTACSAPLSSAAACASRRYAAGSTPGSSPPRSSTPPPRSSNPGRRRRGEGRRPAAARWPRTPPAASPRPVGCGGCGRCWGAGSWHCTCRLIARGRMGPPSRSGRWSGRRWPRWRCSWSSGPATDRPSSPTSPLALACRRPRGSPPTMAEPGPGRPPTRPGDEPGWPAGPARVGPLAGVRVLDLSRILAGPFATMQLADLGADVIKVEAPGTGDETRRWGPPFAADGTAAYFLAINRNKRAITLDLGHPAAAALARRLALAADVVVDNFLPGRLERFGLDHDSLTGINPRVVTCTISGYGSDGPAAERPGFDFLIQAEGGIMSVTGQAGDQPTKVGVAIADLAAGLFATIGVLAALRERDATGRGRRVEVSLLDAQVGMLGNQAMNWLVGGMTPGRMGNAHPNISPYESYRTSDGSIAIGVGTERQFAKLAEALGIPEVASDRRFRGNASRVAHRADLKRLVERQLAEHDRRTWLERLAAAGVPAAPINSIPEVFADPLVRGRVLVEVDGVPQVRSPVRVDGQPVPVDSAPPALGRDTDAVLRGLGLDDAELMALREDQAI